MKLFNEFGEPLKTPESWTEYGSIEVFLTDNEEENHGFDINILEGKTQFKRVIATLEQMIEIKKYAQEARQAIERQIDNDNDMKNTENWLVKNSRNW